MAQPALSACGLQGADSLPPLTLLKQHCGVDGSFLIAAILGHRLKSSKDNQVLLVAAQHTYHHYSSACMRLSYNVGPARESGQLQVLDVAGELYRNYPGGYSADLANVTNQIRAFLAAHPTGTVLLDDLTYFLNFGHTEAQLIDVVEQLLTGTGSFVVKINTAELYGTFCAVLDDLAQTEIRLERLPSGQFREVDGRLSVSRFPSGNGAGRTPMEVKRVERAVLYKVHERNVKVFVPGEIGIKRL